MEQAHNDLVEDSDGATDASSLDKQLPQSQCEDRLHSQGEPSEISGKATVLVGQPVEQLDFLGSNEDSPPVVPLAHEADVQATKIGAFGPAVAEADRAIQRAHEVAEKTFGIAEQELSIGLPAVQSKIYAAVCDLEARGLVGSFLAERRVSRHGNARNEYSVLIRAFTRRKHKNLRQALTKTAAVIALARILRVAPEQFDEWRKKWSIEKAARTYREYQKSSAVQKVAKDEVEFFLAGGDGPFLPATAATRGYAGRQLAVLDCAEDLDGGYRVVRVLPCDKNSFYRIVMSVLRKHAESKITKAAS